MENPDLRMAMGMKPDQKGVRVRRVDPTAPESKVLRPSDVILSFDGVDIANDGTGIFISSLECSLSFSSFFLKVFKWQCQHYVANATILFSFLLTHS